MNDHKQVSIYSFIKDLPNICSLLGLLSAVIGIYFAIQGNFPASIIAMLWAALFDWYDGIIARKMKGRTKEQGVFGAQLDSMIDIVSFGVLPAILLLSYGNYDIWFIPGAFIIIASCAVRLSYFNMYGLIDNTTYKGLSVDNNALILAFFFLFENSFQHATFSILFYLVLMSIAILNLSSIPMPKLGGKWIYVLVTYVFILTCVYGYQLWDPL